MVQAFLWTLVSLLLPLIVEGQLGYGMNNYYGSPNSYYNRCYNYCGYNPLSYSGGLNAYGLNNNYGYLRPGGIAGNPYASTLANPYYGYGQLGMAGQYSPYSMTGGGLGALDPLATGSLYGTNGYSSGMYSGSSLQMPFQQHLNFPLIQHPSLLNREPFLLGPDGLPYMGDFGVPGGMLSRPFDMFDEANNFNSPILSPFRKHAASHSANSTPKKPKTEPVEGAKDEKTFASIVSLDQLIKEMDKF